MFRRFHNYQQSQKILRYKAQLRAAQNNNELLKIAERVCFEEGEIIDYRNNPMIAMVVVSAILGVVLFLGILGFIPLDNLPPKVVSWGGGVVLALFIISILVLSRRHQLFKRLNDLIVQKAIQFKYEFSADEVLPDELKACPDLWRGNYSREIELALKGRYQGNLHQIPYHFCHLHYVDKEVRQVSTSKGGSRTEVTYHHYDRYFVFIKFPWVTGVALRSDGHNRIDLKEKGKTASKEFNKSYILTALSQMQCARFAIPITVLHMLKFKKILREPNFIFSDAGWLAVGFNNKELMAPDIKSSLKTPETFYNELKVGVRVPRMEQLFELLHQLAEQHDDNFNVTPL